jgi:hypothetical protein
VEVLTEASADLSAASRDSEGAAIVPIRIDAATYFEFFYNRKLI